MEEDIEMFDTESSNTEIRYLTLELMKIAVKEGKSFDEVAEEFIRNTMKLREMIEQKFLPKRKPFKAVKHNEG